MIRAGVLKYAEYILDTSKTVEILDDAMRADKRGRPTNRDALRLLLLGLYLTLHDRGSARVTDIYETLTNNLALQDQLRLGIRTRSTENTSFSAFSIHDLYYQTKRIDRTLGYGIGRHPDLDPDERARRRQAIVTFCDRLMDVFDLGFTSGTYALDGTAIEAWARGRKDNGNHNADQIDADARYGHRTITNISMTGMQFGYTEHALVRLPHRDTPANKEPRLLVRFELTGANDDIVDVSLDLLDRVTGPLSDLVNDSHYHYKEHSRWNQVLIAKGINQHFDLRSDEQAFHDHDRARWNSGWPHCPATPDSLANIPSPGMNATNDEWQAHHDLIAGRQAFAMRRINPLDSNNVARYQCPALDGRVGCPLRAGTVKPAIANGLPVIENPPGSGNDLEPLPACCTQQSFQTTVPDDLAKLYQKHYWGSRQQRAEYKKRTYVEGKFGATKNAATERLDRGLHQFVGIALHHVVEAMVNASYNTRVLRNWASRQIAANPEFVHRDHPLLQPVNDPDEYFMRVNGVTAYNLLGDPIDGTE